MTREQIQDVLLDEIGPDYQSEIDNVICALPVEVESWSDEDSLELARRLFAVSIEE